MISNEFNMYVESLSVLTLLRIGQLASKLLRPMETPVISTNQNLKLGFSTNRHQQALTEEIFHDIRGGGPPLSVTY